MSQTVDNTSRYSTGKIYFLKTSVAGAAVALSAHQAPGLYINNNTRRQKHPLDDCLISTDGIHYRILENPGAVNC